MFDMTNLFDVTNLGAIAQIILIDISLAGDNAIIVGMAAAGLPLEQRRRAVMIGIVAATVLRIIFAIFAVKLLSVVGLMAAGGLILLWVAWKMYRDLRHMQKMDPNEKVDDAPAQPHAPKKFSDAITQIVIADVSMSLDNVLGVAGVARDHLDILIFGLVLSVALMGVASSWVARMVARKPWVGFIGLAVVLYTALHMIWDGAKELHQLAVG